MQQLQCRLLSVHFMVQRINSKNRRKEKARMAQKCCFWSWNICCWSFLQYSQTEACALGHGWLIRTNSNDGNRQFPVLVQCQEKVLHHRLLDKFSLSEYSNLPTMLIYCKILCKIFEGFFVCWFFQLELWFWTEPVPKVGFGQGNLLGFFVH